MKTNIEAPDENDKALIKALEMEEDFILEGEPEEQPPEDTPPEEQPHQSEDPPKDDTTGLDDEPVDLLEKYSKAPEIPPEQAQLKQQEATLNQKYATLNQTAEQIQALNSIRDDKGNSLLEMNKEQFNDYLQHLQDTGKLDEAAKAQYNRSKADDLLAAYQQQAASYKQDYESYQEFKETVEELPRWTQVGDEFEASYPGFRDKVGGKVREYIEPYITKGSPQFSQQVYNLTRSDDGKRQVVVQALQLLGLIDEVKSLVDGGQPKAEKKPSAPDVTTPRKKVQVNTPERDSTASKAEKVASLSQKEFNKLSDDEITAALFASLNGDSD